VIIKIVRMTIGVELNGRFPEQRRNLVLNCLGYRVESILGSMLGKAIIDITMSRYSVSIKPNRLSGIEIELYDDKDKQVPPEIETAFVAILAEKLRSLPEGLVKDSESISVTFTTGNNVEERLERTAITTDVLY
jgi:hypothetical protein